MVAATLTAGGVFATVVLNYDDGSIEGRHVAGSALFTGPSVGLRFTKKSQSNDECDNLASDDATG